jgi:hypothetical protein
MIKNTIKTDIALYKSNIPKYKPYFRYAQRDAKRRGIKIRIIKLSQEYMPETGGGAEKIILYWQDRQTGTMWAVWREERIVV